MVVGRELDALVAEKVMGLPCPGLPTDNAYSYIGRVEREGWYLQSSGYDSGDVREIVPAPYSTSIAAAWEVVEKLKADGWDIHIDSMGFNNDIEGEWRTFFSHPHEMGDQRAHVFGDGDTVAEAVCKSALAAVAAVGIPPIPRDET